MKVRVKIVIEAFVEVELTPAADATWFEVLDQARAGAFEKLNDSWPEWLETTSVNAKEVIFN